MPIYEYQCSACGHSLEAFQKMSEDPLTACPECKGETLQKLVSAAGFQLKGTGWYVTDFRGKNKGEGSDSASKTSTSTPAKSDSNTTATPATPPSTSSDSGTKGDKS